MAKASHILQAVTLDGQYTTRRCHICEAITHTLTFTGILSSEELAKVKVSILAAGNRLQSKGRPYWTILEAHGPLCAKTVMRTGLMSSHHVHVSWHTPLSHPPFR